MDEPTIVIIDDMRDHREMVEAVIRIVSSNANVLHAMRGIDGFNLIQTNHKPPAKKVNLVLLDLRLGYQHLYGLEVYKLIRAIDPHIPVMIVTADILDAGNALDELKKVDEYLRVFAKPLDVRQIAVNIREVLFDKVS